MRIKTTKTDDLAPLATIVEATGLFPSDALPGFFAETKGPGENAGIWLTIHGEDGPIGFCVAAPEKLTDGTWNMLAIAVSPDSQRSRAGKMLVEALEEKLKASNARILIVDTSGTEEFDGARAFYRSAGYLEVSRIPEFWGQGADKVTFWKSLR